SNVRAAFFARDSVQAIENLYRIGQKDLARRFFKAISDYVSQRVEFVLLMELAYELQRPDWAINAAKAAAQKNMLVGAGSFPVLSMRIPTPPELAFTHALIRQESLFNADAGSPAGARGLMQLMPGTAKGMCRKLDIRYSDSRLTDPDFNVRLGTAFVQEQLDQFDGSIILALAAYNAGPRRAREWIEQFGDPRSSRIDPIDWVEMMPIYETRNYVQRIIENLQFYRARLNGGQAPLQIVRDLKR
ncbi:MAG: lytic transglycosylase domain-containing protein, partial [Alphaproteobacteria bacterium]|nr:lytic transglycosylase domain-containing protein [Alphaproteobacteria bacterium]